MIEWKGMRARDSGDNMAEKDLEILNSLKWTGLG